MIIRKKCPTCGADMRIDYLPAQPARFGGDGAPAGTDIDCCQVCGAEIDADSPTLAAIAEGREELTAERLAGDRIAGDAVRRVERVEELANAGTEARGNRVASGALLGIPGSGGGNAG